MVYKGRSYSWMILGYPYFRKPPYGITHASSILGRTNGSVIPWSYRIHARLILPQAAEPSKPAPAKPSEPEPSPSPAAAAGSGTAAVRQQREAGHVGSFWQVDFGQTMGLSHGSWRCPMMPWIAMVKSAKSPCCHRWQRRKLNPGARQSIRGISSCAWVKTCENPKISEENRIA